MEHISSPLQAVKNQAAPSNSETVEGKNSTSQSRDKCQDCKGTGWAFVDGKAKKCKTCIRHDLEVKIRNSIPLRFRYCSFETYKPKNSKQAAALTEMRKFYLPDFDGDYPGENFFIVGDYGSGKTHLLYSQYREVALCDDIDVFVRSTHELIHELQSAETGGTSEILSALKPYDDSEPDIHLFWDDADKFKVSDFRLEALFDVIDKIYKHECRLTVTSNMELSELQEKLSPAICRRIDDMCKRIEL